MLQRVWRKAKPLTLLVGMQNGLATMENSVEIPLKTGNRTAISSVIQSCPTLCDPMDHSHSDWCEMVPHSGFDLHFSDNE